MGGLVSAQPYRIYLKDKGEQKLSAVNPHDILSSEAVERRAMRGISIDQYDLPVSPDYRTILEAHGLVESMHSRWLNYVKVPDIEDVALIESLPFVSRVESVKPSRLIFAEQVVTVADTPSYGLAANQIEMLNGQYLHQRGYQGQGMRIAVLDGGFQGSKGLPGLDSLWAEARVKDSKSFIDTDTAVFRGGGHGTTVLSILAGYIDSQYVGSAWKADYYLYRTEFEPTETTLEMDNWVEAAERADSLGVDIITTSLGYTEFDGGIGDYSYVDMDGNTTIITKAADLAASRGILVVSSAGNLGDASWRYLSAPSDGDSVLSVGAVWPDQSAASFSSWGPSADGRIKPDVSAQGVNTAILTPAGVSFGNGTSFSCPLISGLAACLWQANMTSNNMQILDAIRNNASQTYTPDNKLGFGIANFQDAQWSISNPEFQVQDPGELLTIFPNPVAEKLRVNAGELKIERIFLYDMDGVMIRDYDITDQSELELAMPAERGVYILALHASGKVLLHKIIRE